MNIPGKSASQSLTVQLVVAAPSSAETPSSPLLTAPEVSPVRRVMVRAEILLEIFPDSQVQNITVWTRDHDWTKKDGEVSHAVCSKMEHPDCNKLMRFDKDIAVITLCKPLMFTEGKLSQVFLTVLPHDVLHSCPANLPARVRPGLR